MHIGKLKPSSERNLKSFFSTTNTTTETTGDNNLDSASGEELPREC